MKKAILIIVVATALISCKKQPNINGTFIVAYSYSPESPSRKSLPYESKAKLINISKEGIDIIYFQEDLRFYNYAKTVSYQQNKNEVVLNYDDITDSLTVVFVNQDSLVCALNNKMIVYKRLPNLPPIKISKKDFGAYKMTSAKGSGDTLDFINDTNYIHEFKREPKIETWDLVEFGNYKFLTLGLGMFMPYLVTEENNEEIKLSFIGTSEFEIKLQPIEKIDNTDKLLGKWRCALDSENPIPPQVNKTDLDSSYYFMDLDFTPYSVTTHYYGLPSTKYWQLNTTGNLLYFPYEISHVMPTWKILRLENGEMDLEMIQYYSWDKIFKKYYYTFKRVE